MSGLEIIGVVLGAAPLIITALQEYQKLELGKKRDTFLKRSYHIGRMRNALVSQQKLIQGDVDLLLRYAGVETTTVNGTVGYGSLEALLLRDEVKEEIQAFLGDRYASYLTTLAECEKVLVETAKSITSFAQGSWVVQGSLAGMLAANRHFDGAGSDVWRRVKFSMRRADIDQVISELDRATTTLQRLSQQSRHIKTFAGADTKTNSTVSLLHKVQVRAAKLHRALSWTWASHCPGLHRTRLHLQPRIGPSMLTSKAITFQVTLEGHDSSLSSDPILCTCVVHHFERQAIENSCATKVKVSFGQLGNTTVVSPEPIDQGMCHVISQSYNCRPEALTLYIDENNDTQLYHRKTLLNAHDLLTAWPSHANVVSLRDVLSTPSIRFLLTARVRMAAVVASSLLQLHTTPWASGLRKDGVYFAQEGSAHVDVQHPFILHEFHVNHVDPVLPPSKRQGRVELLELGILIIELWENTTLENFASAAGLDLEDTYDSRKRAAQRWLDEVEESMLNPAYDAAVSCVECGFEATVIDLNDTKLKNALIRLVVEPLWRSCER